MKKKCIALCDNNYCRMRKYLFAMKLTFLLFFIGIMSLSAASIYSQEKKITLNLEKVSVFDVFREIESQSEFVFIYKNEAVSQKNKVSIRVSGATVDKVLDSVLKDLGVKYEILDKQIIITPERSESAAPRRTEAVSTGENSQQPQKKQISGTVTDEKGSPVPGATVMVKGTTVGTITDMDGNFSHAVPADSKVLVVSFVGMKTKEIPVGNQQQFRIVLQEENVGIEEVVVVGYGVQKKESVVGAITQVDNTTLVRTGSSTVTNAITGKLSGVLTIQNTGKPGQNDAEIIVRGVSSWNNSAPLVLVDGVERDFKSLDPNEINTISVLKDASATAVFGAKGANGVIIVTTKRGIEGKPKMDFSATYGMSWAARMPEHFDAATTLNAYNEALKSGGRYDIAIDKEVIDQYVNPRPLVINGKEYPVELTRLIYPDVNWYKEVARSFAPSYNGNFNVQGGTEFVKYFCSLGYLHEGDYFKSYTDGQYDDTRFNFDRFNYRANLDFALTKSTQLQFNAGGDISITNQPKSETWREIFSASTVSFPSHYPSWVLDLIPDIDYPDASGMRVASVAEARFPSYWGNPYYRLNQTSFNNYTDSKFFTDLVLNQKLDFITKGLSVGAKTSLSTYYRVRSLYTDNELTKQYVLRLNNINTESNPWYRDDNLFYWYPSALDINVGGLESGYYTNLYYQANLNYDRTFADKHAVSALLLFNREKKRAGTDFAYLNEAWVARGTYSFDSKYLFEFNIGYTGSERFASGNRFGFFPSGAIGWVVTEEPFMKKMAPWMNKLKFRYSDGLVGSDAAPERWLYQSFYYKGGNNGSYGNVSYGTNSAIYEDRGANQKAQWEQARKRDIGAEFSIFKSLISVNFDYFWEDRDKMLITPLYNVLTANNSKALNLGSLKKQGYELELIYNKKTSYGLEYDFRGMISYNENRIIAKNDLPYAPEYMKEAGKAWGGTTIGVKTAGDGYFTTVDDIHNNPAPTTVNNLVTGDYKYIDYNGDGLINMYDRYPVDGSKYPPYVFSVGGGFNYKNFEFNILFTGNLEKYVEYNMVWDNEFYMGDMRIHASSADFWRPDNQNADHATLHYNGTAMSSPNLGWGGGEANRGYDMQLVDHFWRRANYIRLKDVYLGYNMKPNFMKRMFGVESVVVYGTGNNLLTLTELIEGDPERKDFREGFYPQMASVKFGLKVVF